MGWDGTTQWTGIADVKNELRASIARNGGVILGEAGRGEFWFVIEKTENGEKRRFLCLTLIEKHGDCWMQKHMDEDMFPYYSNCPDRLIALVGEPKTDLARNWRAWRLQKRADAAREWNAGDQFLLFGDATRPCRVLARHGRGYIFLDHHGRRFKVQPCNMTPIAATAAEAPAAPPVAPSLDAESNP